MTALRLDTGRIFKSEETPDGFLRVWMTVSRTGPLRYRNDDGSDRVEHVSPQTLFDKNSLDTAWGKPITYLHPRSGKVDADNARELQRGMTQQGLLINQDFLTVVGVLTDRQAIDAVQGGDRQVSAGYLTDLVPRADGSFDQTNRRYNHFAIVPAGRAGEQVKVHLDNAEPQTVLRCDAVTEGDRVDRYWSAGDRGTNVNLDGATMRKVNLYGIDYEFEPDAAQAVAKLKQDAESAATELEALRADKARLDGELAGEKTKATDLQAKLDAAATEAEQAKQRTDAAPIGDRIALWQVVVPAIRADKADFEPDYNLDAAGIKRLWVEHRNPEAIARLDSYGSDAEKAAYLDAIYEGCKPTAETQRENSNARTDALFGQIRGDMGSSDRGSGRKGGGKNDAGDMSARRRGRPLPGMASASK